MPTTPKTVGGALRAHLLNETDITAIYRGYAPEGTNAPAIVIHDNIAVNTRDLGKDVWVLSETAQVDLYEELGGEVSLADQVHRAIHGASLTVDGISVYRCAVVARTQDPTDEGDEDNLTRTVYTVNIVRTAA